MKVEIKGDKEENIISKSCGERRNLEQISSLCFPTSSNTYFGANRSKSYFNSGSKINSLVVLPFLKKEKRTLASTTNFILVNSFSSTLTLRSCEDARCMMQDASQTCILYLASRKEESQKLTSSRHNNSYDRR